MNADRRVLLDDLERCLDRLKLLVNCDPRMPFVAYMNHFVAKLEEAVKMMREEP